MPGHRKSQATLTHIFLSGASWDCLGSNYLSVHSCNYNLWIKKGKDFLFPSLPSWEQWFPPCVLPRCSPAWGFVTFAVRAAPQSSSALLSVFRYLGNFSLDTERACLAMHSSERSVEHIYIFGRGDQGAWKKKIVFCFLILYIQFFLERVRAPDILDYCSMGYITLERTSFLENSPDAPMTSLGEIAKSAKPSAGPDWRRSFLTLFLPSVPLHPGHPFSPRLVPLPEHDPWLGFCSELAVRVETFPSCSNHLHSGSLCVSRPGSLALV